MGDYTGLPLLERLEEGVPLAFSDIANADPALLIGIAVFSIAATLPMWFLFYRVLRTP
jgi:hypothetical protein